MSLIFLTHSFFSAIVYKIIKSNFLCPLPLYSLSPLLFHCKYLYFLESSHWLDRSCPWIKSFSDTSKCSNNVFGIITLIYLKGCGGGQFEQVFFTFKSKYCIIKEKLKGGKNKISKNLLNCFLNKPKWFWCKKKKKKIFFFFL